MFEARLPVHIDPIRYAETGRILEGYMPFDGMERLGESLVGHGDKIEVSLEFGIDSEGIRYMRGRLIADLSLTCQRCMEPAPFHIDTEVSLALVSAGSNDEALPSHYEPLVVGAEPLYLRELIEDELILALPLVAKHPEGECPAVAAGGDEDESPAGEEKENPFAALRGLKLNQ